MMKKILKKKIKVFEKEISIGLILVVVMIGLAGAALLQYYGQITQTVTVAQGVVLTGGDCDTQGVCTETVSFDACNEHISEEYLLSSSTTATVPLGINSNVTPPEDGVSSTVQFVLNNTDGECPGETCEKRITILASDVGVETLNDLNTIEWEAFVESGYLPHIDVFLEGGQALVFEYAKVQKPYDNVGDYPLGVVNTFGDRGIINNDSGAWISPGSPGPPHMEWFTLAEWKAGKSGNTSYSDGTFRDTYDIDGNTKVLRFELEVDNWMKNISSHRFEGDDAISTVKNILINGEPVEISLKGNDNLAFNLLTKAHCLVKGGNYTIVTEISAR